MKKITLGFLFAYISLICAHAAEIKIAVLDAHAAIIASGLYTQDIERIQSLEKRLSQQLTKLENKLIVERQAFQTNNATWDAERLILKQKNIADLEIRINRNRSDAQYVLRRENQQLDARSIRLLKKAVQAYGKSHQYTVIIQKGQNIFYDDESIDISAEIGRQMKRMH